MRKNRLEDLLKRKFSSVSKFFSAQSRRVVENSSDSRSDEFIKKQLRDASRLGGDLIVMRSY